MKERKPRIKKSRKPTRERKVTNPPQITGFWGRAASPYRPGIFSKRYFMEHGGEACAADIHHALSEEIERLNMVRIEAGEKPLRRPTYSSFAKYFHWFKLLGLVELTGRQEPAVYDFLKPRQFYCLTAKGEAEEEGWADPLRTMHPEFG